MEKTMRTAELKNTGVAGLESPSRTWRIERSGRPCLTFEGELVAADDGSHEGGVGQNRYHKLAIYKTAGGRFVIAINYLTLWQGELCHAEAHVVAQSEVVNVLADYSPGARCHCIMPATEDIQNELEQVCWQLAIRYSEQVRRLLAKFPEFDDTVS